jgi:hypothetical protein
MKTRKPLKGLLLAIIATFIFSACTQENSRQEEVESTSAKKLRHVVMFKFKETATPEDIAKVEKAFTALPGKISAIRNFEWGTNNSPERLNKGFTHCFLLTFNSEEDRSIYLPHPDHQNFGKEISAYIQDVIVVDYWTPAE